jgi:hypothetical protein
MHDQSSHKSEYDMNGGESSNTNLHKVTWNIRGLIWTV